MNQLAQARVDFGFHKVEEAILQNVYQATVDLGLPSGSASARLRDHVYLGETFIAGCRVLGEIQMDMYDEHPGLAYFSSDFSTQADLPAMTLGQAKQHLSKEVIEAIWYSQMTDDGGDRHGWIEGLDLLDNLGNVVAAGSYRDGSIHWLEVGVIDIPATRAKASKLKNEASFESCWDNFDTARNLRNQADNLMKVASIAENAPRLAESS